MQDSTFHYLFRVLRCRHDESLIAFNGDGYDYIGKVQQSTKKSGDFVVTDKQKNHNESPLHTCLLQGLSKGDAMDNAIQKAVELGVNAIYPLQTDYAALKLSDERLEKKYRHWQAIIISACEQSRRATIPTLQPLKPLSAVIAEIDSDQKLLLHPYQDKHSPTLSTLAKQSAQSAAVLIGPEGGLSDTEVAQAKQSGFYQLSLGQRILRTETATVSALTLLQLLWGDYAK